MWVFVRICSKSFIQDVSFIRGNVTLAECRFINLSDPTLSHSYVLMKTAAFCYQRVAISFCFRWNPVLLFLFCVPLINDFNLFFKFQFAMALCKHLTHLIILHEIVMSSLNTDQLYVFYMKKYLESRSNVFQFQQIVSLSVFTVFCKICEQGKVFSKARQIYFEFYRLLTH